MDPLEKAILRLEPRVDLLHECLGMGLFAEVTCTSDGYFLGRARGDSGFNAFLGFPSENALRRTKKLFERLSREYQDEIVRHLRARRIPLTAVGIADSKN